MSSDASTRAGSQSFRLGAGLLAGLALGHRSLIGAATGSEQFELAIAHFVLDVLACLVGIVTVASTYERLTQATDEADMQVDDAENQEEEGEAQLTQSPFAVPELSQPSGESSREP